MLAKLISKQILKLGGWRLVGEIPKDVPKAVIIGAPHTSNWDFMWGRAALYVFDIPLRYLIKNNYFNNKLAAWFFRATGGIPVDRSKSTNLTGELAKLLNEKKNLYLLFPPEGTRKWVPRWKTGFYRVAVDTGLPIVIGFMDYKKRELGFLDVFHPTGNLPEDLKTIESYYQDVTGQNPELFNKHIYERKAS